MVVFRIGLCHWWLLVESEGSILCQLLAENQLIMELKRYHSLLHLSLINQAKLA
jgi:hypothetical protein